jgi:hypothetical protein
MKIGVLVTLLFLIVLGTTGTVYVLSSRTVEIVVPVGFRGLVRIDQNPSAPPMQKTIWKRIVSIPRSGETTIPSLDVLLRPHRERASFSDGSPLRVVFPGEIATGVALQAMNTPPTAQIFYFVGTRDELLRYLELHWENLYSTAPTNGGGHQEPP